MSNKNIMMKDSNQQVTTGEALKELLKFVDTLNEDQMKVVYCIAKILFNDVLTPEEIEEFLDLVEQNAITRYKAACLK